MAAKAMDRQARSLLGLLRRSGDLAVGAQATREGLRADRVGLVLVTYDAAEGTAAGFGEADRFGTSERVGMAIGRPPTAVVGAPRGALSDALASAVEKCNRLTGGRPVQEQGVVS